MENFDFPSDLKSAEVTPGYKKKSKNSKHFVEYFKCMRDAYMNNYSLILNFFLSPYQCGF